MSTVGLNARDIAELVRSARVKASEVVADHLRQVELMEPTLSALLSQRPDKAMAEAAQLEGRKDLKELPLAGVPVTIKDSVDVAGEPTRLGSLATPEAPREADDELVRRLRQAGCVVIGKTRQPELGIWHFTQSNLGVTRNPWNLDHTPGGSSGGAAASVASAMAPIAQGSDGGGSIRIPAAFSGLFGIKPGPGLVPIAGGLTEHWFGMTQWGPLATTVSDAGLLLDVLAGTTRFRDLEAQTRPLRLAMSLRPPAAGVRLDREIRLAVEASADALIDAGHTVTITDPPYSPEFPLYFLHRFFAGIAWEVDDLRLPAEKLEPRTQRMMRIGRYLNRYHPVPRDGVERPFQRFMTWFQDYDVLITPSSAQPWAPAAGWDHKGYLATLFAGTNQVPFTPAWNVLNLPAASIPAGLTRDGAPIGVQLIARRGGEEILLSLARQLEELRPWPRHAPMAAVNSGGAAPEPPVPARREQGGLARSRG
jgi:amidase